MEFQRRDLGFGSIFGSALAILTDEVEVVLLGFSLGDAQASTMLPYVASFASHTVSPIVKIIAMNSALGAVESPRIFVS